MSYIMGWYVHDLYRYEIPFAWIQQCITCRYHQQNKNEKEFLHDRHVVISFSNSHLRSFPICHVVMIYYRKWELQYQVVLEPHKVRTKFHKNVSADFQVEVDTHTQRGDVKVCFFHFRNVSRLSKVHRLKFVPEAESERLLSVSRTSYFVLW